jgi:hypothetical protein
VRVLENNVLFSKQFTKFERKQGNGYDYEIECCLGQQSDDELFLEQFIGNGDFRITVERESSPYILRKRDCARFVWSKVIRVAGSKTLERA